MATIYPLTRTPDGKPAPGTHWRMTWRHKGYPSVSKNFPKYEEAKAYGSYLDTQRNAGLPVAVTRLRATTVEDVIDRFIPYVEATWRSWVNAVGRLNYFKTLSWARMDLTQDVQGALMDYRDHRMKGTGGHKKCLPQTLTKEFVILSLMFKWAINELRVPLTVNPAKGVKMPSPIGGVRNVRWTDADVTAFLAYLGFTDYDHTPLPGRQGSVAWCFPWLVLFLRNFGNLRLGSIVGIKRSRVDMARGCITFRQGELKNGQAFECPMDDKAMEVMQAYLAYLDRIGRGQQDRLFPSNAKSLGARVLRLRNLFADENPEFAHVKGLTLHDQRHTWTTELINERPDMPQLMLLKVTGRESMASLQRYFNPDVKDLRGAMKRIYNPDVAQLRGTTKPGAAPANAELAALREQMAELMAQNQRLVDKLLEKS